MIKLPIKIKIDTNKDFGIDKRIDSLPKGMYEIIIQKPKRTSKQNRAMHKFFDIIAEQLNETGNYFKGDFFKSGFETEWTPTLVKEILWRSIQEAMYNKTSTSKLTTKELTTVADYLEKYLVDNKGVDVEFPSIDYLLNKES